MTDQIFNKIITIASKEETKTKTGTNTTVKLHDQDGERFSFFKKKKDGELTSVASQFRNMELDEGSTVKIGYVKESFESNGKTIEINKIINIQETQESPIKTEATISSKPAKEIDWDNIAVGKCQTVFLEAYISSGKTIQDAMLQVVSARKLAELVVYGQTQGEKEPLIGEKPPTLEDMADEIPF